MPEPTTSRKGLGGPKTPEGKARASLNAMKTGAYASSQQGLQKLAEEIGIKHDEIIEALFCFYEPKDAIENTLVRRIARCTWRIYITEAMEARMLDRHGLPNRPGEVYAAIIRHERTCDIQLHRAMAALEKKRDRDAKRRSQDKCVDFRNELPRPSFLRSAHAHREPGFVPSEPPSDVTVSSQV